MLGTVNGEVERLLAEGQNAARKGDKASARALLTQVVERDPHNEMAWMWLSGVVQEPEEQQICLENVLVINPQNDKARRGLDFISTKTGIPPHYPSAEAAQPPAVTELTSPLKSESPLYSELSAGQWPSVPDIAGGVPSDLAWMQTLSSGSEDASTSDGNPMSGWPDSTPQPLQQEQLDWSNPGGEFNVMSIADGVDDRLSQFEAGGSTPPWADAGTTDDSGKNFGMESFAAMGMSGAGAGAASPFGAPAEGSGFSDMGPMGLHSDSNLPTPDELPAFKESSDQPWYLKSDQLSTPRDETYDGSTASDPSLGSKSRSKTKTPTETVDCPNCKATVPDTTLTCPQCKYAFFVNCPHCHELVDAVDAKEGVTDNCPYCAKPIKRRELGMAGTDSVISYKSTKASGDSMAKEAMERMEAAANVKPPLSFRWVVDVVWLVLIVAAVWALSQLPTWFHWVGQY